MTHTIIIGDGPGGLSAALFLAKAGHTVTVFGQDATPMHHAQLYNYLGIPDVSGTDFQRIAREHATDHGATIQDDAVVAIDHEGSMVTVRSDERADLTADYLILAGGKTSQKLATALGLPVDDGRISVDTEFRTQIDRVYAIGRLVRPERSQAIISAGAGATAALDILSREAGTDVHDWDSPPEHDHDHPNL
ncbi:thioredoxin reductase [Nitriliruptoraceae bacterium ZYF776]|nr:thioredoxin reductase [Profundirhabdus halotolerans]